jgi:hypothetical protein
MEMSKPYDSQALVKALEAEGIQGGLEVVKKSVAVLADFLRSSAELSKEGLVGHLDNFAIPGINYFEKLALDKLSSLEAEIAPPAPAAPESVEAPKPADPA